MDICQENAVLDILGDTWEGSWARLPVAGAVMETIGGVPHLCIRIHPHFGCHRSS
jgi:hypothetical protein